MKFLFIYPPMETIITNKMFSFEGYAPPLGILYLASILEKNGHKVEVIDYTAEQYHPDRLKQKINSSDAVGLTVLATTLKASSEISDTIKKYDKNIPIIIGGPQCLVSPEKCMKDIKADICVIGEAENTIKDIEKYLITGNGIEKIKNIYYRKNGKINKNNGIGVIENLDKLPFPNRKLIEKYKYGNMSGLNLSKGKFTSMISSRGCPFKCRFCISSKYPIKKYRSRSAENVIDEIKIISEKFDSLLIADDNFLANRKRVKTIMEKIIEEKIDLEFWIEGARVDSADKKLFKLMKKAGVRAIEFGIESGNNDVLSFYNKQTTTQEIKKAVNISNKTGFITIGNFILGAPIENQKYFQNTIDFAKKLSLDIAFFYQLGYLKGCDLWDEANKKGIIKSDEIAVQSGSDNGLGDLSTETIQKWITKAYKDYYTNPKYILTQILRAAKRRDLSFIKAGYNMFIKGNNDLK